MNAVESFRGNTSASWVCKDANPALGIGSDKHELLVLNGVPLKHDAILSYRGQKGRSLFMK